jgi:hypothetical protein
VRNGELITYPQISTAFAGMPRRTVERHIALLEREKYIRSEEVRGSGKRYWVANPIRWSSLASQTHHKYVEPQDVPTTKIAKGHHNRVEAPTTSLSQTHNKFVEANKEARTKNKPNNSKNSTRAPTFTPPTLEEVRTYCQERGNRVNPEAWLDSYRSKGWKVGRTPMVDWRAAVRTWEHNGYDDNRRNDGKFREQTREQRLQAEFDYIREHSSKLH